MSNYPLKTLHRFIKLAAALLAILILTACSTGAPALDLPETYDSPLSPLHFQYPEGWVTSTLPDSSVVVVSRRELLTDPLEFQPGDCGMIATVFSPEYLASLVSNEPALGDILKSTPPQAGEVLDLVMMRIDRTAKRKATLDLGGRTAAYAVLDDNPDDNDERQIALMIIADPSGDYIYMQPIASKDSMKSTCENTFLAMAETIQKAPDEP